MKTKFGLLAATCGVLALTACAYKPPVGQAYWQRLEDDSALYMTGPKAQQQLHEDIASCVRQVDELVELDGLRRKTPPDAHREYHSALESSGDLDWYDTPTRLGDKKVAHKDFNDFESCMRHEGWERVRFVRYETQLKAKRHYKEAQDTRKWGGVPGGNVDAVEPNRRAAMAVQESGDYEDLNR